MLKFVKKMLDLLKVVEIYEKFFQYLVVNYSPKFLYENPPVVNWV